MSGPLLSTRGDRLPVNPRRNKVAPESRKRVAKACNACNLRRAKCSGQTPCDRCRKAERECRYPSVEETVTIRKSEYEALLRGSTGTGRRPSESSSSTERGHSFAPRQPHPNGIGDTSHKADSQQEGRILEDPHGTARYLGESSGATFLNQLRLHMAETISMSRLALDSTETRFIASLGRYQTHDSKILPQIPDNMRTIPSREEAWRMVTALRPGKQTGPLSAASGGLYYWTDIESLMVQYDHYLDSHTVNDNRVLALVNAIFAVACQLDPNCAPAWATAGGQTFFLRARTLLGNPLDTASLTDANVLTLLGFYLLNNNRRDAAFMHASTGLYIYMVHGVHRGWSIDEDGKRRFWQAYILDRWLSSLMGRPTIVPDEAIKLDAPRDAPGLPPADGLRVHVELSKIIHYIAANVYGVAKHSNEPRSTALCVHKSLNRLKEWEHDLPAALRYQPGRMDQDMAAIHLQMAANHVKILTTRPWLFDAFKTQTTSICFEGHKVGDFLHREEIDLAIEGARQTINIIRSLNDTREQTYLIHTSIHYAFNAAMALELNRILSPSDLPSDREDISYITALLLSQLGGNQPFAVDCGQVLSDLAPLTDKLCAKAQSYVGLPEFRHSMTLPPMLEAQSYHGMELHGLTD